MIIGCGPAWNSVRALTTELNLDEYVSFTGPGYISEESLVRHVSTIDIGVEPVPPNPFSNRSTMIKVTEYMALGKPIVAFDLCEHRRSAASAALYVAGDGEVELAKGIMTLMDDPELRRKFPDAFPASGPGALPVDTFRDPPNRPDIDKLLNPRFHAVLAVIMTRYQRILDAVRALPDGEGIQILVQ